MYRRIKYRVVFYLIVSLFGLQASTVHAIAPLALADGTEFVFETHAADGEKLMIWIPSEAGPQSSDVTIANELARQGIEVWRVDLIEAHFLPQAQSSLDRIPTGDVAAIVEYVVSKTGKQVFVAGSGRAAMPILQGIQEWQNRHTDQSTLGGIILLSPKFFVETPDPGQAAVLMPIVSQTNAPVFILQPKQSPWFWKLPITKPALQISGSSIYLQIIEKVRDRFYFRPDATDYEKQQTKKLSQWLLNATSLLEALPKQNRRVFKLTSEVPKVRIGKKERSLQLFQGDPVPPLLKLKNVKGREVDLGEYKGKVVLVNFWASWCPPCVFEMPSMQRLQDKYRKKGFVILGVNMAEDKATIDQFLKSKVKVNFPILLDSDGAALKRWQVFAFPTSYVIDKKGEIRYALFGGLEWDTPDIMDKISALLVE